jgi:hypothetical protein
MKKRSFITFIHVYKNNELTKLLKKSFDTFSEHPIKIYRTDDLDSFYNFEDSNFWKNFIYIYY